MAMAALVCSSFTFFTTLFFGYLAKRFGWPSRFSSKKYAYIRDFNKNALIWTLVNRDVKPSKK
jgi:hypothetical protein